MHLGNLYFCKKNYKAVGISEEYNSYLVLQINISVVDKIIITYDLRCILTNKKSIIFNEASFIASVIPTLNEHLIFKVKFQEKIRFTTETFRPDAACMTNVMTSTRM